MLKPLKDYGINSKDLKTAVTGLNDSGFLSEKLKTVGIKGEDLLVAFMDAVDALPDKELKKLPKEVKKFYDELPQTVFDDAPQKGAAEPAGEATPGVESKCPTFGDHNPAEEDCIACANDFPEENAACIAATEQNKKAGKGKGKKSKGSGTSKPRTAKKSRYGHIPGTMAGDIDDLLYLGGNIEDFTKIIASRHDRTEGKARAKIRAHAGYLVKLRGLKIEDKEGYMKCDTEFLKGVNPELVTVTLTEVAAPKKAKK